MIGIAGLWKTEMFLIASVIVFTVYFANVASGAFGSGVFFGDVTEMLVLFVATILFVIAILKSEAARNRKDDG